MLNFKIWIKKNNKDNRKWDPKEERAKTNAFSGRWQIMGRWGHGDTSWQGPRKDDLANKNGTNVKQCKE